MNIVFVGSLDHGKSTLIGRLLHDAGLPDVTDSLEEEQAELRTIDMTQARLGRHTLIDVPGHREFLRNALTGATQADAAVLVIDTPNDETVLWRRLLDFLGLPFLTVSNKIDLHAPIPDAIPVSALRGDGMKALRRALDSLPEPRPVDAPLRLTIQDRFDGAVFGRVESGELRNGKFTFVPGDRAHDVRLIGADRAGPGECVAFPGDLERGRVGYAGERPAVVDRFIAPVWWLAEAREVTLRCATQSVAARVVSSEPHDLEPLRTCALELDRPAVFDPHVPSLRRFALSRGEEVVGFGLF